VALVASAWGRKLRWRHEPDWGHSVAGWTLGTARMKPVAEMAVAGEVAELARAR
jgi:hypothetical protein